MADTSTGGTSSDITINGEVQLAPVTLNKVETEIKNESFKIDPIQISSGGINTNVTNETFKLEPIDVNQTDINITNDTLKVEQSLLIPKYQSKEQFIATLAREFYLYSKIDNTSYAIRATNTSFRNAIIFWNMLTNNGYGYSMVDNEDLKPVSFNNDEEVSYINTSYISYSHVGYSNIIYSYINYTYICNTDIKNTIIDNCSILNVYDETKQINYERMPTTYTNKSYINNKNIGYSFISNKSYISYSYVNASNINYNYLTNCYLYNNKIDENTCKFL